MEVDGEGSDGGGEEVDMLAEEEAAFEEWSLATRSAAAATAADAEAFYDPVAAVATADADADTDDATDDGISVVFMTPPEETLGALPVVSNQVDAPATAAVGAAAATTPAAAEPAAAAAAGATMAASTKEDVVAGVKAAAATVHAGTLDALQARDNLSASPMRQTWGSTEKPIEIEID
jgi:hypothetical protein